MAHKKKRHEYLLDKYSLVREFHLAFGHPVSNVPVPLPASRKDKRANWLVEEVDELRSATKIEDHVDAVVDLLYFAYGTLVEMGVPPNELFEIVHKANMSKLPIGGKALVYEDGKIAKPPEWKAPEEAIRSVLRSTAIGSFLGCEYSEHRNFTSFDDECLASSIALCVARLVGVTRFDPHVVRAKISASASSSISEFSSDLSKGTPVNTENWNSMPIFQKLGVAFDYQRVNYFPEWEFEQSIERAFCEGQEVIATFSAGKFFGHSRVELGHAMALCEISDGQVKYFDTADDNFGYHLASLDELYAACRYRDAGLLVVSAKAQ